MKSKRKLAAVAIAAALGLVGVGASAGSSGENQTPADLYVQFAVMPVKGGFVARAVIAQAPAPPPAGSPYTRVFQARAHTRAVAIDRLVGRMTDELSPRKIVTMFGLAIGEEDTR